MQQFSPNCFEKSSHEQHRQPRRTLHTDVLLDRIPNSRVGAENLGSASLTCGAGDATQSE
jgi:hypothetical protein